MEGYGNFVEILGSRFPACNIQIYKNHPELYHYVPNSEASGELWFGCYFELLFETGTNVVVTQEAAAEANGLCETVCKNDPNFLEHYIVEEYSSLRTQEPCYAWHCAGEEELHNLLRSLKDGMGQPMAHQS